MRYLFILCLFISCNSKKETGTNIELIDYPKEIDSLGIRTKYDEAKWTLYCLYGQDTLSNYDKAGRRMSFGMLDMEYNGTEMRHDTTVINLTFKYFDQDTITHRTHAPHYINYTYGGIIYIGKSDSIRGYVGYSFNGEMYMVGYDSTLSDCKPLQPDVIKYIQNNKDRIHPWFRKEAVKRGIIKA